MKAYWFSRLDGTTQNGGAYVEGETYRMPRGAQIVPCVSGFHSSPTPWEALGYAPGPLLWLVEIPKPRPGEYEDDKQATRSRKHIRSVDVTALLHEFACRCAEDVLPLFEAKYPNDNRPRKAIETKRRWLKREASDSELDAARDAARDAAWPAAWAAARDAAWAAARDAARDAAWAAARAAARDAARDAAWPAAWAAAWAAARDAAWPAARDAAWAAARPAAWAAAWAAARAAKMAEYRTWANDMLLSALGVPQ